MTIENLKCFIALAQELNFTRAAEKLHMSQASMSRKIAGVEEELMVTLFQRDHHRVLLTNAGQEFYGRMVPILEAYDDAVVVTQNVDKGVKDTIQIGVGVYEHALLMPVIKGFISRNPISKLNCVQFKYRELIEQFESGRIDLMITSDQFLNMLSQEELRKILLSNSPWRLAINVNNPLAKKDPVNMSDLSNQNVVTMFEGSISKVRSEYRGEVTLNAIDYVNSHETKLMLINADRGVGFIPEFVDVSPYPEIVTRSLNPIYLPRKYYAVLKKDNHNPYVRKLAEMLGEYYRPTLWFNGQT